MGKQAPAAPMPPPVAAPPPTTAVRGPVRGTDEDQTPTEVVAQRSEEKQAVVTSPDTEPTPQPKKERSLPASVIDTQTAGRKEEKRIAGMKGRRKTRVTGPRGLLTPAPVKKRSLMSS